MKGDDDEGARMSDVELDLADINLEQTARLSLGPRIGHNKSFGINQSRIET